MTRRHCCDSVKLDELLYSAIRYNIVEDEFSVLQPPKSPGNKKIKLEIGVLDKHFAWLSILMETISVYEGKNNSWKKLMKIHIRKNYPVISSWYLFVNGQVLMIIRNKKIEYEPDGDKLVLEKGFEKNDFFLYSPEEKTFDKFRIQGAENCKRETSHTQSDTTSNHHQQWRIEVAGRG